MKRFMALFLFISTLFLYSIPPVFASFLQESNAYFSIDSDITESWYMNDTALEIIRYEPPYYAIQGNVIRERIGNHQIECMTCIWYYDYDKQVMKCKPISLTYYDEYGNILGKYTDDLSIETVSPMAYNEKRNLLCVVGNLYFFKCYHIFFFKDDNKKYGFTL